MLMMKKVWFLPLLLVLAACGPSEADKSVAAPKPKAASKVEYVEITEASMAQAASAASEAAASEAVASAAEVHLGGELAEQNKAKWQKYVCDEQQKIEVRYYKSHAGPAAQLKFKGLNVDVPYSPELSDEDLSAFSNGEMTWTISNLIQTDFYQEADGFLVRHEPTEGVGEEGVVDNLLLQNCVPVN